MKHTIMAVAVTTLMLANSSAFADSFKVGYMTTLSGSAGIIGKQMQNGVNLALEHTGGKPVSYTHLTLPTSG